MLQALAHKSPPPPKNTNGGDTPRAGAESTTPFYPDAGRIAPIYAR